MRAKQFIEAALGTTAKRPAREGARPARGHNPVKEGIIDMAALSAKAKQLLAQGLPEQKVIEQLVKEGTPVRFAQQAVQAAQINEARSSAQVKLQRAWEREQQKSAASAKRGREYMDQIKQDVAKKNDSEKKVDEGDKHSLIGKFKRGEELYGKVKSSFKDIGDAQKKGDSEAASKAFKKHERYANLRAPGTWTKVDEGEVVKFPKKHKGDLENTHDCPKCGGDLQSGKYMGHQVKVCMPCKQVYLPPNSGIDHKGDKIKDDGVSEGVDIGREWMSDTELDQYVPAHLQQQWRELLGYDRNGNPSALWANLTGGYEPDINDRQHRALMVKVANKWFAAKKIPNVKFFSVRDADDELEWLVQIGPEGVSDKDLEEIAGAFPSPSTREKWAKDAAASNAAEAQRQAQLKAQQLQKNTAEVEKQQQINHHSLAAEIPTKEEVMDQLGRDLELIEKASRGLCLSSKPDDDLGASNLASCKSQGLRARDGDKSHKLGKSSKSRVKVGGHRIKGNKYGGPLPDWS